MQGEGREAREKNKTEDSDQYSKNGLVMLRSNIEVTKSKIYNRSSIYVKNLYHVVEMK